MNPLLSVITPVYNVETYLDRCVGSILSQSYQEIELILIDDGSTDGSNVKCDSWAMKDKRIVVIHKENGGVSSARNEGLKMVKGDYITFVDSDDFLAPETYKENMEYLMSHPEVDILQYPFCHYTNDHEILKFHKPSSQTIVGTEEIFRNWWSGSPIELVIWDKIFKRQILENIRFPVGHIAEDAILVPELVKRSKRLNISEQGLYFYQRMRNNSYTYSFDFYQHLDLFYAHAAIYKCFSSFPNLSTDKVKAFTRLYRRLITAKQTDENADISTELSLIRHSFPSWHEIIVSQNDEKPWLSVAKFLPGSLFVKLCLIYLRCIQYWQKCG